jgi:hypothetical protein
MKPGIGQEALRLYAGQAKGNSKTASAIGFVGLALWAMLFTLCVPAEAQQPKKVPRIGYLTGGQHPR